jgi:RNA polymerase sigma-70 factor (ECF subfamily)
MTEHQGSIAELLVAARAGSSDSFNRLFTECAPRLLRLASKRLDPRLEAKADPSDLVQETLLEACRDFPSFHGLAEDELLGWLRRLLLNNIFNFTRRYRGTSKRNVAREVPLPDEFSRPFGRELRCAAGAPGDAIEAQEQARLLDRALERMPDDYRLVLRLRYENEQSFEEIARRMQRSNNAVRKLCARAVKALKKETATPSPSAVLSRS